MRISFSTSITATTRWCKGWRTILVTRLRSPLHGPLVGARLCHRLRAHLHQRPGRLLTGLASGEALCPTFRDALERSACVTRCSNPPRPKPGNPSGISWEADSHDNEQHRAGRSQDGVPGVSSSRKKLGTDYGFCRPHEKAMGPMGLLGHMRSWREKRRGIWPIFLGVSCAALRGGARVMRSRNPPSRRKASSSWRICPVEKVVGLVNQADDDIGDDFRGPGFQIGLIGFIGHISEAPNLRQTTPLRCPSPIGVDRVCASSRGSQSGAPRGWHARRWSA